VKAVSLLGAERRLLFVLAAVQFTHITDFVIMMPLGPQFLREFQISPSEFSFLVSSYSISAAICTLLAAFFMDRWDRKRSLLVIYGGFLCSTFLCGLSTGYFQLLTTRILAGAFGGTVGAIALAIVGDKIPPERRGAAMGILMTAFSVATVFGLPLGLAIAANGGWHWAFLCLAGVGVLVWGTALKQIPLCRDHLNVVHPDTRWQEMVSLLGESRNRLGLVFTSLVIGATFVIIPFLSPSLVANVGVKESELSWVYFVGGICTFFSSPLIGRLSDRWGHARVFRVLALLSIIPFLLITHLTPLPLVQVLLCTSFFMVISGGRMVPSMALLSSIVPPMVRGAYMSLVTVAQQVTMGMMGLLAGVIVDKAPSGELLFYPRAGFVAVGFTLIALFVLQRFERLGKQRP
jgi:predicted MFS family arabinose efflux permease